MPYMYKLLRQDMTSHNNQKWEIGIPAEISSKFPGNEMCSNQVLHCYDDPELAVIFNPIHANYDNPLLFRIRTTEIVASDGCKFATKKQTLIKQLPLPHISDETKIAFAILCALEVCEDTEFITWANNWLTGMDRSKEKAALVSYNAYIRSTAAYYASAAAASSSASAAAASSSAYKQNNKINFKALLQQAKNYS